MTISEFERDVYRVVKLIPKGKVSTYGQIAKKIGRPDSARAVGNALNKNPFAPLVPCHRVVKGNGELGGYNGGCSNKQKLLRTEGVIIKNNKITDFEKILNKFDN